MEIFSLKELMEKHNDSIHFIDVDPSVTSVYAIGDVHGCYEEMVELYNDCMNHASTNNKSAMVFFMGDLIDRGPFFHETIEFIANTPNAYCLLGNHELNFYLEQMGKVCRSKSRAVSHEKFDLLDSVKKDMVMKTIGDMPNAVSIKFEDHTGRNYMSIILTHAPIRDIEYINGNTNSNLNGPQCCMRATGVDMVALEKNVRDTIMVHGHQSWDFKPVNIQLKEQMDFSNRLINLDSGCVYGDVLTAICINTLEVLEVNAKAAYSGRH